MIFDNPYPVPSGWTERRLGKVATLQRGFDLPTADRKPGNVPVISSSGVSGIHNTAMVTAPGIVTGRYGTVGTIFWIEEDFWPLNTSLFVKNFHGNYPRFIYYLLQRVNLKRLSDKTGVPGINRNDVHKIKILLPPIEEQKRIVEILEVWDSAIALTEQLITAKQKLKSQLAASLFNSKHLSTQGSLSVKRLGELAFCFSGGTPSRSNPEYFNGEIPWIKSGEINKEFIFSTEEKIKKIAVENSSTKIVDAGTILVAMYGATAGKIAITQIDAAINQAILAVIPNDEVTRDFLYYFLQFSMNQIVRKVQGGQPNLNAKIIKETKIIIPSLETQNSIGQLFKSLDQEIYDLNYLLELYVQQKQGLMQKLLTGEWRIPAKEVAA